MPSSLEETVQAKVRDVLLLCLLTLVLIAESVFFLEHGQTDKRNRRSYPTPAAIQPAWVKW